jgi:AcrR family transcriptional regulator
VATRPYTTRRGRSPESVARVLDAAEHLLAEGTFHTATMDELAAAAGVSRATVFNRFGSKLGVLEALYDRSVASPEMQAIREALVLEDPVAALEAVIEAVCAIWEALGVLLAQLKAIAVLEPGALVLIEQQQKDQRADLRGLTRRLARAGRLGPGLSEARATAALHMLTSLESFLQLRHEYGLSLRQTRQTIANLARTLLQG